MLRRLPGRADLAGAGGVGAGEPGQRAGCSHGGLGRPPQPPARPAWPTGTGPSPG